MKPILLFSVFFLLLSMARAQTAGSSVESGSAGAWNENEETLFSGQPEKQTGNVRFGLQAGSMFQSGFSGGGMMMHSVSPSVIWQLSNRFSLHAGTSIFSMQGMGMTPFGGYPGMHQGQHMMGAPGQPFWGTSVYAMGVYQLNDRLRISGGGFAERFQGGMPMMNPMAFQDPRHGVMFGMEYQVSEGFTIGAGMRVSRGHNPWYAYPNQLFYHPAQHTPWASPGPLPAPGFVR